MSESKDKDLADRVMDLPLPLLLLASPVVTLIAAPFGIYQDLKEMFRRRCRYARKRSIAGTPLGLSRFEKRAK